MFVSNMWVRERAKDDVDDRGVQAGVLNDDQDLSSLSHTPFTRSPDQYKYNFNSISTNLI